MKPSRNGKITNTFRKQLSIMSCHTTTNVLFVDLIDKNNLGADESMAESAMCTALQIVEAARNVRLYDPPEADTLPKRKFVFAPCGPALEQAPFVTTILLACPSSDFHLVHKHASDDFVTHLSDSDQA